MHMQAMARCWRFGQKRHSFVYRLVSAHTIEEKILQRCVTCWVMQHAAVFLVTCA